MKMVFRQVKGQDERMLFIILVDDNGLEFDKYPIYITKEMKEKLPVLEDTLLKIKDIIQMTYNSGKKGEKIEFVTEDVNI